MINTIEENQQQTLDHLNEIWLFGYGSLIFKVDFPYLEKRPAYVEGYARRFWQASHDHRGTPEKPGRVVTLIEAKDEVCHGMAFRVSPDVFEHLDHREKNGYLRRFTPLFFQHGEQPVEGLVYIGGPHNPAFLGEAPLDDIATQIAFSEGPSGKNAEYLLKLDEALDALGAVDPHVQLLAERVRKLLA